MPNYRKMKYLEGSNGASGEYPEYGAIFMSSWSTKKECLKRELFGLPMGQADFVKQVKAGMILFLFEFESRELHGVYQACSDGAINIEPDAFRYSGKQFPAQVKFTEMWRCRPLCESENYFTAKKFNFGLSKYQVKGLLKLFSLKKVERSRQDKTSVLKPTGKLANRLGNTVSDRGFGGTDGDVDRELPYRVKSAGDLIGRRLTENYDRGDKSDIRIDYNSIQGNEYSRETSVVRRRLVDPKWDVSKDNNRFERDALTTYPVVNDQRVPKNSRNTTSGWLENEYHEKDGFNQASLWSNHEERLEADLVDPAQRSVRLEPPYGTNREHYDPCNPGIMGEALMKSSKLGLDALNVDSMGSTSYAGNSNHALTEEYIPVDAYVRPSESVQPFLDEHNGGRTKNTSRLGLDLYIPMPTEYPEFKASIGMFGVAGSELESRNDHLRHSQFPGLVTSTGAARNFEGMSYPSSHSIFPSFAYPLSSRDLSPKDGVNNEVAYQNQDGVNNEIAYQNQEDFGGHVSRPKDGFVQDSQIYPSFTYPSTSRDGVDLYPENRLKNQTNQRHEEFGGNAFDRENKAIRTEDYVSPSEFERKRTRKSVFSRLGLPPKERDAEKDTSPDNESVDEVMVFLNDRHKHWMERKRPNVSPKSPKKKKEKKHAREVLDSDLMLPFHETTPENSLDCEENMEHSPPKLPFIDFQRRSKVRSTSDNPTQESKGSPEHSALPNKKRKLLRPNLIEVKPEEKGGNNNNPIKNVLASQPACKFPVRDSLGREEQ